MKILCIDGGGVFGIIPAYFLSTVDISMFDMYCGTSVGSILALGYASGITSENMFDIFHNSIGPIFSETNFILFRAPEFKDKLLNQMLQDVLPGQLKDLKKNIAIPAYNIENERPKIYDNFSGQDDEENTWEVARRSCAAPSYFASWKGCVDGGLVANSPTLVAIGAAVTKLGVDFEDIELFSIGTGRKTNKVTGDQVNKWYRWQWLSPMLKMLTTGNEVTADYFTKLIPLKKYTRFNAVPLKGGWDFTDSSCVDECVALSKKYEQEFLKQYTDFLKE